MSILNSDGTPADVQSLHDSTAIDGDTITLPAGTFTWATPVSLIKQIKLQGAGIGQTIIQDGFTGSSTITILAKAGLVSWVDGIEFRDNGGGFFHGAMLYLACFDRSITDPQNDGRAIRVSNCKFDHLNTFSIVTDDVIGVIDHCTFIGSPTKIFIYSYGKNWGGNRASPSFTSDVSQSDPTALGTNKAGFVEACTFVYDSASSRTSNTIGTGAKTFTTTFSGAGGIMPGDSLKIVYQGDESKFMLGTVTSYSGSTLVMNITSVAGSGTFSEWSMLVNGGAFGGSPHYAFTDGYGGARMVYRHNIGTRGWFEQHGTESSQRFRGFRAFEIYQNIFHANGGGSCISNARSGTGVIWGNTADGYQNPTVMLLGDYREEGDYQPFGAADGTNVWDVNDTTNYTGNGIGGGTNGLYASGTVSSAGSLTMTVSGTPWTTDQFTNRQIKRTSGSGAGQTFSTIRSNTNNTLIYVPSPAGIDSLSFAPGDTFEIHTVIHSIDQPGRVRGSLIVNDPPTLPGGWNDQVTEPIYAWNNTYESGAAILFGAAAGSVTQNVHYINNGTMAMPGYTAYTYPHPLVAASAPTFTSANNATFTTGVGGTFQVTANGTTPITFSLASGSWPTGTSMNSAGLITVGTSTAFGVTSVTLGAANGTAPDATQGFTLNIVSVPATGGGFLF